MSRRKTFVQYFQRHQRWFKASDEVLKAMFAARGGGSLAYGLAMFSSFGSAMGLLNPRDDGWKVMMNFGLQDADLTIGGFICEIMLKRMPYDVVAVSQWGTTTHLWLHPNGTPLAGAMFQGTKYSDGPFVPWDGSEALFDVVREIVWKESSELQLDVLKSEDGAWRAAGRFHW